MRALTEVIEEASVEVITNAGAANRLVPWNKREQARHALRRLGPRPARAGQRRACTVPHCAAIPLDDRLRWKVRVGYMGMATVSWERE